MEIAVKFCQFIALRPTLCTIFSIDYFSDNCDILLAVDAPTANKNMAKTYTTQQTFADIELCTQIE